MKTLYTLLTFFLVTAAFAEELIVMNIPVIGRATEAEVKFDFNKDLGRAWVSAEVFEPRTIMMEQELSYSQNYRELVPGLRLDLENGTLVLERNGQIVECAYLKKSGRWIFKEEYLKPTGRCIFRTSTVKLSVDDGFEISYKKHIEVTLIVD